MITISTTTINVILGIIAIFSTVFAVFAYFKNPQIKQDQDKISMQAEIDELKRDIKEVKETHIKNVEQDMKILNKNISDLSITVTRLSTIIDERIPKVK